MGARLGDPPWRSRLGFRQLRLGSQGEPPTRAPCPVTSSRGSKRSPERLDLSELQDLGDRHRRWGNGSCGPSDMDSHSRTEQILGRCLVRRCTTNRHYRVARLRQYRSCREDWTIRGTRGGPTVRGAVEVAHVPALVRLLTDEAVLEMSPGCGDTEAALTTACSWRPSKASWAAASESRATSCSPIHACSRRLTCPSRFLSASFARRDESGRCRRYVRVSFDWRDNL